MTFRRILVFPAALLIAVSALSASQAKPDVTGVWAGSFTRSNGTQSEAHFNLKQTGEDITGTAGPGLDRQVAISNGKVTTVKDVTSVTFDATQPNGLVMKFDLKLVEGRLKGKATAEADGQKREADIDVSREKK